MFTIEQLASMVQGVVAGAPNRRKRLAARRSLRAECERLEERQLLSSTATEYSHSGTAFYYYGVGYNPPCDQPDDLDQDAEDDGSPDPSANGATQGSSGTGGASQGYNAIGGSVQSPEANLRGGTGAGSSPSMVTTQQPATGVGAEGSLGGQIRDSEGPIDWATGFPVVYSIDLSSDGSGSSWGQTRTWAGQPLTSGPNGPGWSSMEMPALVQAGGSTLVLVNSGTDQRWFDENGSTNLYTERGPFQDTLTTAGITSAPITIIDDQGDQMEFNDFAGTNVDGQIAQYTDAAGNVTTFSYDHTTGNLTNVTRSTTVGGTSSTEQYVYTFLPSGDPNAGQLQSVVLCRKVGAGTLTAVESVNYTYYTGNNNDGNLGDLATAATATGGLSGPPMLGTTTHASTFSPGTYYYVVTAVLPSGETGASPEAAIAVSSGQEVNLSWGSVGGATSYNVYRGTASGAEQLVANVPSGTAYNDTGTTTTSPTPPTIDTTMYRYYAPQLTSLTCNNPGGSASAPVTGTLNNNGFVVGEGITISGASNSVFNGTFTITAVTTNTFTFTVNGTPPNGAVAGSTVASGGYNGALKFVVGPQAYARLSAGVPSGTTPMTASDTQVATFADNYFIYQDYFDSGSNVRYRVSQESVQGAGCSCTGNNGQGTFTFSYPISNNSPGSTDYNVYENKTIETLPDGNTYTVYTDFADEVMLSVYTDTSSGLPTSGERTAWYTRFDSQGRIILMAQPSAITLPASLSTLEAYSDLVDYSGGTYGVLLNASSGLINTADYYSSVGWQFSGTAGIASNGGSITGNSVPTAAGGTQAAFITGGASFTQTIGGWTAGTYTLTLSVAQLILGGGQSLQLSIDGGTPISIPTFTATTYTPETTASFMVSAGIHTFTLSGTGGSGVTAMIDSLNFPHTPTPTPTPAPPSIVDSGFESPSLASGAVVYDPLGTTATSSSAGGVTGYFKDSNVQQGYNGTAIVQDTKTYYSRGGSISGIYPERYPMATDTIYQDTAGAVPETTSYSYTWQGTTVMPQSITSTLPVVTSGQNGSGSAITGTVYIDSYGRPVWSVDGDGYINYTAYDPNGTGAIVEQVSDVDPTTIVSPPVSAPSRSGGLPTALNLITTYTVDNYGRVTMEKSPNENQTAGTGDVTYTVYNDQTHEVRSYPGWHEIPGTSNYTTTGPATVTREYRSNASVVSGQATAAGSTTTLIDTTNLSSGTYVGLTLYVYSGTDAGQITTVTGYNSSTHTLTFSPALSTATDTTSKYVLYVPLYEETLTITPPVEATSTPSGAESISASNIQSLARSLTNAGGETVEVDQYPTLSGASYSQSSTYLGTSGTNFYPTLDAFDDRGRQVHTQTATGTITDLVYDGLGRLLSTWVGTNDTGATWSNPGAGGGSNNMIKTEDDFYDTQTAPIPPTLTNSTAGGSLAATNYYVRVTYLMASGETAGSIETSIAVTASHLLLVDSPASVTGATTYNVYVSTSSGAELLQNASPISIGTNWTEPSTGLISGVAVPVNAVGDGNLTEVVDHPNDGSADRVSLSYPDWRDRVVATKSGAQAPASETAASPAVNRPIAYYTLDNLGEVTETDQYNGDGVMLSYTSGVPTAPSSSLRVAQTTASYDLLGQQHVNTVFSIASGGTPSTYGLVTNIYHDARGNEIETINPGGEVDKSAFDGAGRDIADYVTDGAGGTTYADPVSLTSDDVLTEALTSYDADGNPTLTTNIEADHNNAATGALPTVTTNNEDRALYTANWFDNADRETDSANFGSNAGQQYTYASLPPGRNLVGTATATGSTTTLVDSSLPEPANYFIGYTLSITAGTDSGHSSTVTGYSAGGTLTFSPALSSATDSTSVYSLVPAALTGTAASGTTTTLVDTSHLTQPVGSFVGWTLTITAGTDSGKTATVTGNSTAGHLTFAPAMSSAIDNTSQYSLTLPALLNHTDYDSAGNAFRTTDPRGVATVDSFDLMARTTQTVAAWNGGSVTSSTNQTTTYAYDGDSNLTSQTAVMPSGTNSQQTVYVYGVTTGGGSDINSNDLLKTTEYPDLSTGVASSSASNDITNKYNALGEVLTMTDQNGTTHTYSRNTLGQLTSDSVSTLGSGVNGTIRSHTYSYTALGEPALSTSYSTTTPTPTPSNQVLDVYNGLGQLTQEYQSHSGAVVTTPTPTATSSVSYAYAGLGSAAQNYSRLSSMTYPDGTILHYGYSSTLDSAISRVDFLADDNGSGGVGSHIVDYTYLGLGTVASSADANGITLTYFTPSSSSSDSGDEYTGLDRFDRIIEQKYTTPTPTPTPTTDDFAYGYDRDGDVLYKNNLLSSTNSELYHANSSTSGDNNTAYDPLGREAAFRRGTLSASGNNGSGALDTVTTGSSKSYTLDALGNQASVNSRNELTTTGNTYDNDGNQVNQAVGGSCLPLTYDAWNEMVTDCVCSCGCSTTCETMGYDALGREISDSYNLVGGGSGTESKYYSASGQVLQNTCGTTTDRFVWAPDYVNDLVLRDRKVGATTTRTFAQHDANFNVTALVNTSGAVQERFVYDPYGNVTVLTAAWGLTSDATWQVRFQGMWLDNTTGLYKTLNRDYNPGEARWMEADPAGYIDGSSRYQTFDSDPTSRRDSLGLNPHSNDGLSGRPGVKNLTNAPIIVERDRGDGEPLDWRILKPDETASDAVDWDYVWSKGNWWKVRPSMGAKVRDWTRGDYKICNAYVGWEIPLFTIEDKQIIYDFDGNSHRSGGFRQIYQVPPTDSEWYPGKKGESLPWNVFVDYVRSWLDTFGRGDQSMAALGTDIDALTSVTPIQPRPKQ